VGTGAFEAVTDSGTLNFLTSEDTIRVASGGNAADDAAGAGARTILCTGLDDNFNPVTATLTTAGGSASSSSTSSFRRLLTATVMTTGTDHTANTGDIVIESTGGTALGTIPAGLGKLQNAAYCVKAGYTAYLRRIITQIDSGKGATTRAIIADATQTSAPFGKVFAPGRIIGLQGNQELLFQTLTAIPEKHDFWFEAIASGASATEVVVAFDLLLVED